MYIGGPYAWCEGITLLEGARTHAGPSHVGVRGARILRVSWLSPSPTKCGLRTLMLLYMPAANEQLSNWMADGGVRSLPVGVGSCSKAKRMNDPCDRRQGVETSIRTGT